MATTFILTEKQLNEIQSIIRRGNTVELKKENGKIVIVEVGRKVISKTLTTG